MKRGFGTGKSIVIAGAAALVMILAIVLFSIYVIKNNQIQKIDESSYILVDLADRSNVVCCVDSCEIVSDNVTNRPRIQTSGWIIERGCITDYTKRILNVVLKDLSTGDCWRIPTVQSKRSEPTALFWEDVNYNYSGFKADFEVDDRIHYGQNDYELLIEENFSGETHLVDTGISLESWRFSRTFHEIDQETIAQMRSETANDQFQYAVEELNYEAGEDGGSTVKIGMKGWMVQKGVVPTGNPDRVSVVLRNMDTDQYYNVPAKAEKRTDVTGTVGDGTNYTYSGFLVSQEGSSELNPAVNDYEVFLMYSNKKQRSLVSTGISFRSWEASH